MSRVEEIENAVLKLSAAELAAFRDWFVEFDAANWDRQLEDDGADSFLDALAKETLANLRQEGEANR